jgi:hypothetical protein
MMENGVWNDLLVTGVFFGVGPVHEEIVGRIENGFEIPDNVGLDSLKGTKFVKEGSGDNEDFLAVVVAHGGNLTE